MIHLFCFPYAGGSSTRIYREWQDNLPPYIKVHPVELPGRAELRHLLPLQNILQVIEYVNNAIAKFIFADEPFAIFGHSMGALIGFELAHYLRYYGKNPIALFASGYTAPQNTSMRIHTHHLSDETLMEYLSKLGGVPPELNYDKSLSQLILPVIRSDLAICDTYSFKHQEKLDCPIFVFGGIDDPIVNADKLNDWQQMTSKNSVVQMFHGGHFFIDVSQSLLLSSIINALRPAMS